MEFTVQVPGDIAGRITKPELHAAPGFAAGHQLDGFLKAHEGYEDYTMQDLDRELEGLKRLGI
jgi:hypothetical protein